MPTGKIQQCKIEISFAPTYFKGWLIFKPIWHSHKSRKTGYRLRQEFEGADVYTNIKIMAKMPFKNLMKII